MKEKLANFGSSWGWIINLLLLPALFGLGSQWFVTKGEMLAYQKAHAEYVGVKSDNFDDQIATLRRRQDNMETMLIQILPTLKGIESDIKGIQKQLDQHMNQETKRISAIGPYWIDPNIALDMKYFGSHDEFADEAYLIRKALNQ